MSTSGSAAPCMADAASLAERTTPGSEPEQRPLPRVQHQTNAVITSCQSVGSSDKTSRQDGRKLDRTSGFNSPRERQNSHVHDQTLATRETCNVWAQVEVGFGKGTSDMVGQFRNVHPEGRMKLKAIMMNNYAGKN